MRVERLTHRLDEGREGPGEIAVFAFPEPVPVHVHSRAECVVVPVELDQIVSLGGRDQLRGKGAAQFVDLGADGSPIGL
jgi:hypothetical protein